MSSKPLREGEIELSFTVRVVRYTPTSERGRAHLRSGDSGGEWDDDDLKGSIYMPIGGMNPVVTVERPEGFAELYTFDAESLVDAALADFRATQRAPHGSS